SHRAAQRQSSACAVLPGAPSAHRARLHSLLPRHRDRLLRGRQRHLFRSSAADLRLPHRWRAARRRLNRRRYVDTRNAPHWSLTVDADRVAWLTLDRTDSPANSLSREVMEALGTRLSEIELEPPRGVVIGSAKAGFIAGADVREFAQVRTPEEALPFVRAAHAILQRLERLPC